jgi:hypothetical protein
MNLSHQRRTLILLNPSRLAMSSTGTPSARSSTIRERWAIRCSDVPRRTTASNSSRCSVERRTTRVVGMRPGRDIGVLMNTHRSRPDHRLKISAGRY